MFKSPTTSLFRSLVSSSGFSWRASLGCFFSTLRRTPGIYFHESPTGATWHTISLSKDPEALPLGYTAHMPTSPEFVPMIPSEGSAGFDDAPSSGSNDSAPKIPKPIKFEHNPAFTKKILERVMLANLHKDPTYNSLAEAESFRGGVTLHIYDFRNPPPYGRIPDVDDIIGMVRIRAPDHDKGISSIVPNSFEYNPMYRPLTMNGFIDVGDYLNKKLVEECEK